MRRSQRGAYTKTDVKGPLIWSPKYRKRVLTGPGAVRARNRLRQLAGGTRERFPYREGRE